MSSIDLSKYPQTWDDFVGQERAKRQLQIAAAAARQRGDSLPHTLLASGVAGLGKTSLALLTARELGCTFKVVSGKIDAVGASMVLASLKDGDVMFIDEAHQLVRGGKASAEWLLHYLQDGVLIGPRGAEQVPDVTVIAATTDAERLPETILSRFPLRPMLEPYTTEEAMDIARRKAAKVMGALPMPTEVNLRQMALASSHNPRVLGHLIGHLRDLTTVGAASIDDTPEGYDLTEALEWAGLTEDGLTELAERYLVVLHEEFGGRAGLTNLKAILREPGGIEGAERLLAERALIGFTSQGRTLTGAGIQRARQALTRLEEAA